MSLKTCFKWLKPHCCITTSSERDEPGTPSVIKPLNHIYETLLNQGMVTRLWGLFNPSRPPDWIPCVIALWPRRGSAPPGEGRGGRFHSVDLLRHSPTPSRSPGEPRSLEPVTDTLHQNLPLRKTHSALDTTLPPGMCAVAAIKGERLPSCSDLLLSSPFGARRLKIYIVYINILFIYI